MARWRLVIVTILFGLWGGLLHPAEARLFPCPQLATRELVIRLASPWEPERLAAQQELEELGPWATDLVLSHARTGSLPLSGHLLTYLARKGGGEGIAFVTTILLDNSAQPENRAHAAVALGRAGAETAVFDLMLCLHRGPAIIRAACAEALGKIRASRARRLLRRALRDEDDGVMAAAALALVRMGDQQGIHRVVSRYKAGSSTVPGHLAVRNSLLQIIDKWPDYRGIRHRAPQIQNHLLRRWIIEYERGTLPPLVNRSRSTPSTEARHHDE